MAPLQPRGRAKDHQVKLKLDESGGVVLSDGKPVYVDEGGKEHVYDAPALRATLDRLGKDLQSQRSAAEELAEKVKAFGIDRGRATRDHRLGQGGRMGQLRFKM